jgi:Fic family protein
MKSFNAGTYINQGHYKSFQPNPVNKEWVVDDMQLLNLLSRADHSLGRLDMYSQYVNIDLFIRMHIAKEATQSSKIEGTRTNMEDAFMDVRDVATEKRDDWEEVQNYIHAMREAVNLLHTLPFSSRLIRQTHKILLQGVRGKHKNPGEFRRSQNWIGGSSIENAVFIPPAHHVVPELMSDIEFFANNEQNLLPDLLKVAIIHYQFETIHPFLDGNGRVGRLLITLYLVNKGILTRPILYLSDFFEKNRMLYYDNLMRVRTHNDMDQWIRFFLSGVIEISKKGVETFDAIMQLQKNMEMKIQSLGTRGTEARKVVEFLYDQPVIDAGKLGSITGRSKATNYKLLVSLEDLGILKEVTGAQRNKLYVFSEYLELFNS